MPAVDPAGSWCHSGQWCYSIADSATVQKILHCSVKESVIQEVNKFALQGELAGCQHCWMPAGLSSAQWLAHPDRCHDGSTIVLVVLNCKAKGLN